MPKLPPPGDTPPEDEGTGNEHNEYIDIPEPDAAITENRDRKGLAQDVELNAASLAGSWFHRVENGEVVWEGIIVAEIQPAKYLCQVTSGMEGVNRTQVQVVVDLDAMLAKDPGYEWRFYDTEPHMRAAYVEYLAGQRKEVE